MRRRRRGKAGMGVLGALLIGLALAVLGGLTAASILLRPPPVDETTLCRTDAPLAAHTIVLIDATDRLEPRHRRKLRAVLAQERARLNQYERLSVVRINVRRPQEPTLLFSRCLPRPPEDVNPLFENSRLAQARWDEAFEAVLDSAVRRAQSGAPARASPIIESVRAAANDPDFDASIPQRRLVLASDLLEHDPRGFSLYVSGASYEDWAAGSPLPAPDLSAIAVRVVSLDRPEAAALQTAAAEGFWPDFFAAAGAQTVNFDNTSSSQ
jgi:hypothetical protein